jgi:hypothetical protein
VVGLKKKQEKASLFKPLLLQGFASQSSFAYNQYDTGQQRRREVFGYALRGRDLFSSPHDEPAGPQQDQSTRVKDPG